MGQRLARALHVPTSFLYEEDDLLAALLVAAARLTRSRKKVLLANAETLSQSATSRIKKPGNV
jgi:hypothetical protein